MKKNLLTVVILALVLANFVLTALLVFTVLPETKKANQMIDKVCAAIDLELNSGAGSAATNVPVDQIEQFPVNSGEAMTCNFKTGSDGKAHYAVVNAVILMNNKSDGYSKYGAAGLEAKDSIIMDDITSVFNKYTMDEFNADREGVQEEILADLQGVFGADFIVGVNFKTVTTQ